MTTEAEVRDVPNDDLQVVTWRLSRLLAAGFDEVIAVHVAHERAIDLHAVLDLVDRGCPPQLAARILAP